MAQHLQARIYSPAPGETLNSANMPVVGEVFYDPLRKCFGIYTSGVTIDWFLAADDSVLRLLRGQGLSGLLPNGSKHDLKFDFSVPDEIRIIRASTGAVLARFTTAGAFMTLGNPQSTLDTGVYNLLTNAGLGVRRSFISTPSPKNVCVAPNWFAWLSDAQRGKLSVGFSTDVPADAVGSSSLLVDGDPNFTPANCGIRTFLHSLLPFAGQTLTLSVYLKGRVGYTTKVRALNNSRLFDTKQVVGSGNWDRITLTATIPPRSTLLNEDNNLAFDLLYNPTILSNMNWGVAAPMITVGAGLRQFEMRPLELERSMVRSIYAERRLLLQRGGTHLVSWELLPTAPVSELSNTGGHAVTLTDTNSLGTRVTVPDTPTLAEPVEVTLAGYNMPILAESNG